MPLTLEDRKEVKDIASEVYEEKREKFEQMFINEISSVKNSINDLTNRVGKVEISVANIEGSLKILIGVVMLIAGVITSGFIGLLVYFLTH